MYRDKLNYYNYENSVVMNSYYCFQTFSLRCRNYLFSENLIGKIFLQRNKTGILFQNRTCPVLSRDCSCENNFNMTLRGSITVKSEDLPIHKICFRKKDINLNDSFITFGLNNFVCRAFISYFSSKNNFLIDNNLQTCSNQTNLNEIEIKKTTKSSLEIVIYLKLNKQETDCSNIFVYKHEKEGCSELDKTYCQFKTSKVSDYLSFKVCKYFCSTGTIQKLTIMKKPLVWLPDLEICEIATSAYETSLVDNGRDYT